MINWVMGINLSSSIFLSNSTIAGFIPFLRLHKILYTLEKLALDVDWDSAGADLADYVLQGQVAYLESSIGRLYDYHHYLIVPLKSLNVSPDLKTVTKSSLDNLSKTVMNIFGIQVAVERDLNRLH
ncbi:hypothetical protein HZZ02_14950 [Streptococcus danieliae]|nr:hypothetical protein [Streptococcus danieliae]